MTAGLLLSGWMLAAGLLAVLALAWAALAGAASPEGGWAARALVALTAALVVWPGWLARTAEVDGFALRLLLGESAVLAAALVCLLVLSRREGLRLPARVAALACLHLWLALAALAGWPAG